MAIFPEVQNKAQAELDKVVGRGRLPVFCDLESLVYIRAIALESMRWAPVLPLGVSHMVIDDDEYNGYRIPKGTVVIPVSASCLRDLPSTECLTTECVVSNEFLIALKILYQP